MRVKLGFSPCPNDTFMLYALMHAKIDLHGFQFEETILDVEELNEHAVKGTFDMTKLSFRTYYDVCNDYALLHAGAALGHQNGPLLIANAPMSEDELVRATIAIPGDRTTAAFLLHDAYPKVSRTTPMLFSDIESAIASQEVDAGVIIHETRFMYADRGFVLLSDLGEKWEEKTGGPIPLGGFVARHALDERVKVQLADLLEASIRYAMTHYDEVLPYMKHHAQELDNEVIKKHVEMFVNDYSLQLGELGEKAIHTMFASLNKKFSSNQKVCIY